MLTFWKFFTFYRPQMSCLKPLLVDLQNGIKCAIREKFSLDLSLNADYLATFYLLPTPNELSETTFGRLANASYAHFVKNCDLI